MAKAAKNPSLYALVHDIKRFALYNRSVIELAPLQVYYSALVFAPEMSIIKGLFVRYLPVGIRIEPQVHGNWSAALPPLEGHTDWISHASFSPDGKLIASASADGTVRLWDVATGAMLQTLEGYTEDFKAIAFSPDGKQVASASEYAMVHIWDVETGAVLHTFPGYIDIVAAIAFSSDGKMVASAHRDATVRLWDVMTGAEFQTLRENTPFINALAFSPDDKQVASASWFNIVLLWDVATGAVLQKFLGHTRQVTTIIFSLDSKLVASASQDRTVRLWNAATGTNLKVLKVHTMPVGDIRISLSPDGKQVVSASHRIARLWNTETGDALQTLEGHTGVISSVMFSSDGKHVVSASFDNTLRLWDAVTAGAPPVIKGSSHISVSPDESHLQKDKSYSRLIFIDNNSLSTSAPPLELSLKDEWIIRKNKKFLWLPPEHRPYSSAIRPGMIMLKYFPGRIRARLDPRN